MLNLVKGNDGVYTPSTNCDNKTGWPPSKLMQDDCKKLSRWLSNTPHARLNVKEACKKINISSGEDVCLLTLEE